MRIEYGATGTYPTGTWIEGDSFIAPADAYTPKEIEFLTKPAIWQCQYCGSQHWTKDEELQCTKCGAPRDI